MVLCFAVEKNHINKDVEVIGASTTSQTDKLKIMFLKLLNQPGPKISKRPPFQTVNLNAVHQYCFLEYERITSPEKAINYKNLISCYNLDMVCILEVKMHDNSAADFGFISYNKVFDNEGSFNNFDVSLMFLILIKSGLNRAILGYHFRYFPIPVTLSMILFLLG